jgi:gamma-glutamylputrescine oxidase
MKNSLLTSDTQLNQTSYYEASVQRGPVGTALKGALQADAVVVGAGYAGLTSAIELAQRGMRVVVLEADRVCSGASGRNGGQAIVGYASGQQPFEEQLGQADARRAWEMSMESIRLLDAHIKKYRIECDRVHGYLHLADSPRKARALQADMQALHDDYGFESQQVTGDTVRQYIDSPRYCAAAFERVSGHLHPLKFGLGLAQAARDLGVQIYEHSPVREIMRGDKLVAIAPQGRVTARFGVLAGNCTLSEYGPHVAPEITPRIMPVGTYMIATAALEPALCQRLIPSNASACDNNFVLDYFRFSADHRMLFGGRVSYTTATPARLQETMQRRMGQVFPALVNAPVEFVWGGFVDISMNRAPDFGRLGSNLYYLQGFSGHGVAATVLGGRLVAEAVAGQAERFDVFARLQHRNFPGGPLLRMPSLVLGTLYHRLRDLF